VAETSLRHPARAAEFAQHAAAAAEQAANPTARAQAAYALGLSVEEIDPERALLLLERSVHHAEAVENRWIRAFALTESLWLRAKSGQTDTALRGYHDVIDTWFRGGDWANQWLSLRHVFAIFETIGNDVVAATIYGALDRAGVMHTLPLEPGTAHDFDAAVDRLASRLGAEPFTDAAARGRNMRDEEVVRYVLAAISAATP